MDEKQKAARYVKLMHELEDDPENGELYEEVADAWFELGAYGRDYVNQLLEAE